MEELPIRLLSSTDKVEKIKSIITKDCVLLRRTNLDEYLTPYDEIDVEVIRDIDLFNMSTNVYLCKRELNDIENKIKDVNILIHDIENIPFLNDEQLNEYKLDSLKIEQKETLILGFLISKLECIKGPYKKGLGTSNNFEDLNYKIEVKYNPLVLNCFHMESLIICIETDEEISRKRISSYRKAIASDIKVKIMNKKDILIYNYKDIEE